MNSVTVSDELSLVMWQLLLADGGIERRGTGRNYLACAHLLCYSLLEGASSSGHVLCCRWEVCGSS